MGSLPNLISVEVVYATALTQTIIKLQLERGSTIQMAIHEAQRFGVFPQEDLTRYKVGIFSNIKKLDTFLHHGDRVEIYRPLVLSPKEARKKRAGSIL